MGFCPFDVTLSDHDLKKGQLFDSMLEDEDFLAVKNKYKDSLVDQITEGFCGITLFRVPHCDGNLDELTDKKEHLESDDEIYADVNVPDIDEENSNSGPEDIKVLKA